MTPIDYIGTLDGTSFGIGNFLPSSVSLRPPELSAATLSHRSSAASLPRRRYLSISCASPETPTAPPQNPQIELELIPRAQTRGSTEQSQSYKWREAAEEHNGKLMNCGGGGTCTVEIIEGKDLLNERTNAELRYLKKKPESWRLACFTIIGNKENSGKVVVQRLPQRK